jgi:tetratricopeptide (TPR) repeat protein
MMVVEMMRPIPTLWIVLAASVFAQPRDAGLETALRAHQAGQWETAAEGYRAFLKKNPAAFEIRSNLGAVLVKLGLYEDAIVEYRAALAKAPANPGIGFNLGLAYYKAGAIPDAAREFSTVRLIAPNNAQLNLILADCWLQMGENAKVVALLDPMYEAQPGERSVAYVLGTALLRSGQVERGQKVLNAIFAEGDSAEARLLIGTSKLNSADVPGAMAELSKAVELNPSLPSVHSYHGLALLMSGDVAQAAEAFQRELANHPNDFTANLNLAALLKQDQEYGKARTHLDRALRVRPGDTGVRYQLATIALAEGEVEKARTALESVIAEAPEFVEAHVSLATVYYRQKRKADGDRERALVEKLNAEIQARQPKGEPIAPKAVAQP